MLITISLETTGATQYLSPVSASDGIRNQWPTQSINTLRLKVMGQWGEAITLRWDSEGRGGSWGWYSGAQTLNSILTSLSSKQQCSSRSMGECGRCPVYKSRESYRFYCFITASLRFSAYFHWESENALWSPNLVKEQMDLNSLW